MRLWPCFIMQRSPQRPVTFPRLNPEFYALDLPQAALTAAVFFTSHFVVDPDYVLALYPYPYPYHTVLYTTILGSTLNTSELRVSCFDC